MEISRILKRPLITEKSQKLQKLSGKVKVRKEKQAPPIRQKYGFIVDIKATKDDISRAVASMYNVEVESVNTSVNKGKPKSRYSRGQQVKGFTAAYKKAYITLKEGQMIDVYEGLPE